MIDILEKPESNTENKKKFCCPFCQKKLPIWSLFTLKRKMTCPNCGRVVRTEKQVVSFGAGFGYGFGIVYICGFTLKYFGLSLLENLMITVPVALLVILIICIIIYNKSSFK